MEMSDQYVNPGPDPDQEDESRRSEEKETKSYKTTGRINIKGREYNAGETVSLTEDEYKSLSELHAPLGGIDPVSEEEWQSRHEEGIEAQKELIKKRSEQDAEQLERLSARRRDDEDQDIEAKEALERAQGNRPELLGGRGGVQGRVLGESDTDVMRSQGRRPEGPKPPEGVGVQTQDARERQQAYEAERQDRAQREDPARLPPDTRQTRR
jgi:hypothetical protein